VQRAVLLRTREKLELVESMLLLVEARLDALTGPNH
jgi:BMFP domain-containing protein YqiC